MSAPPFTGHPPDPAARVSASYWDEVWQGAGRADTRSEPSRWNVGNRNLQAAVRAHLAGAESLLEIGCAPGKWLAWARRALGCTVAGLDFSEHGIAQTRHRLHVAGVDADVRCEDLFASSFAAGSFHAVWSAGVVEHFDDPVPCLRRHVELTRRGGRILVTIPNYGGWYGRMQGRLDPDNLAIHNLKLMSAEALGDALRAAGATDVIARPFGRFSPWLLSLDRAMPRAIARAASLALNAAGLVQPIEVPSLCPGILAAGRRPA